MTPLELLSRSFDSTELPRFGGVYLLIDDDEVVYVGCSRNLLSRIGNHAHSKLRFNRAMWFRAPWRKSLLIEGALIRFFSPNGNDRCPPYHGKDNDILTSIGLPAYPDEGAGVRPWLDRQATERRRMGRKIRLTARRNREELSLQ